MIREQGRRDEQYTHRNDEAHRSGTGSESHEYLIFTPFFIIFHCVMASVPSASLGCDGHLILIRSPLNHSTCPREALPYGWCLLDELCSDGLTGLLRIAQEHVIVALHTHTHTRTRIDASSVSH